MFALKKHCMHRAYYIQKEPDVPVRQKETTVQKKSQKNILYLFCD